MSSKNPLDECLLTLVESLFSVARIILVVAFLGRTIHDYIKTRSSKTKPKETEDSTSTSSISPTAISEPEPSEAPEKNPEGGWMDFLTNSFAFALHPHNLKITKTQDGNIATDAEASADSEVDAGSKKTSDNPCESQTFSTPPSSPEKSTEEAVPTKPAPTTTTAAATETTVSFSGGSIPFLNLNGGPTGSYNSQDLWTASMFAAHLGYALGSSRPRENSQPCSD